MRAFFLAGVTASGKSRVAQHIAEEQGWAVLSADSMLVYRGMDIGTAKPSARDRARVPHGGVDLVAPDRDYSVWQFRNAALAFLAARAQADRTVIVVGGSGLFIKVLTHGLDATAEAAGPAGRARWEDLLAREGVTALQAALRARAPDRLRALADPENPRRLVRALERTEAGGEAAATWAARRVAPMPGLRWEREALDRRIRQRVDAMLADGLEEEVRALRDRYGALSRTARQAIGYAEIMAVLEARLSREEARERMVVRTRRLAKKQRTWFRSQAAVSWLDIAEGCETRHMVARVMNAWREHGPIEVVGT